jgi:hypothetical protein
MNLDEAKNKIEEYIERNSSFSIDDEDGSWLSFATRQNGSVYDETYSSIDYEAGKQMIAEVSERFSSVIERTSIETCDEFVNINFTLKAQ